MTSSRAPRVLVCGAVLGQPMGGVRRHNQELVPRAARLLAERGGALSILEGRVPIAFALPPAIERLPSNVPAGPPAARVVAEGRAIRATLARAANAGRPFDLVHTAHLPVPHTGDTPCALTIHDLRRLERATTRPILRAAALLVLRTSLRRASLVITVSEHVRAQILDRFGLNPERVRVVPNAADHLPLLPREPDPTRPILCVAHLEPRKNQQVLLRALALDASLPDLWLAGAAKGEERERLDALARELGVAARVRFLGAVDDQELARLYARAGCLVLPSLVEGFGIPVIEAQRASCPVAIAEAGALPEVAGPDAPRFPPEDVEACARALHAALRSPPLAAIDREPWSHAAELLVRAWTSAIRDRP